MEGDNLSSAETFLLVGFSDLPLLQVPLFVTFLLIYLMTFLGNLLIMVLIYTSSQLHSPMYFFLTNLSFIDICFISFIIPQMLAHFFVKGAHISVTECTLHAYISVLMVSVEFLLLSAMAYDRYVAICNPLRYLVIMSKELCLCLVAGCWVTALMAPLPHTLLTSRFSYCKSRTINHFICDFTALMKLSCTSTWNIQIATYAMGSLFALVPFVSLITSYVKIISTILRIRSSEVRRKAFSTCSSHLVVVILFYGSSYATFMRPISTFSLNENKIFSLGYTTVTPSLNPIIYSLKNSDLINALKKRINALRRTKQ